jgi:hypothetical protein
VVAPEVRVNCSGPKSVVVVWAVTAMGKAAKKLRRRSSLRRAKITERFFMARKSPV